jgi:hypothetical protein
MNSDSVQTSPGTPAQDPVRPGTLISHDGMPWRVPAFAKFLRRIHTFMPGLSTLVERRVRDDCRVVRRGLIVRDASE